MEFGDIADIDWPFSLIDMVTRKLLELVLVTSAGDDAEAVERVIVGTTSVVEPELVEDTTEEEEAEKERPVAEAVVDSESPDREFGSTPAPPERFEVVVVYGAVEDEVDKLRYEAVELEALALEALIVSEDEGDKVRSEALELEAVVSVADVDEDEGSATK